MLTPVNNDHVFVLPIYGMESEQYNPIIDKTLSVLQLLFGAAMERVIIDHVYVEEEITSFTFTGLGIVNEKQADFLSRFLEKEICHKVITRNENTDVIQTMTVTVPVWSMNASHPGVCVRTPYAEFITATYEPEAAMGAAIRTCYSKVDPKEMFEKFMEELNESPMKTRERIGELFTGCMESGHHSVFEHFNVTFAVGGSRAMSHQFVRHRIASFSQQSQRYIEADSYPVVIPQSLRTPVQVVRYLMYMETQIREYKLMLADGVEKEDARFVFGNGAFTQITCTMNVRSLMNFFAHRCCTCAQWEIRHIARQLLKLLQEAFPTIFTHPYMGAKCQRLGYCEENPKRTCGRYPSRGEVLNAYVELRELKKQQTAAA